jgi:adenylate cyclase
VMFGTIGDASRLEYTVIGEPVNLAAKLEKHAKVERVRGLCTAETYRLAQSQGYEPRTPPQPRTRRSVAGIEQPLDLLALAPLG